MEYSLVSGAAGVQGRRGTMEDTHVNFDVLDGSEPQHLAPKAGIPFDRLAYYAVYDGHGGVTFRVCPFRLSIKRLFISDLQAETAIKLESSLHKAVFATDEFQAKNLPGALVSGFFANDELLVASVAEGKGI